MLGQSVPPILLYLPDLPWTIVSGNCSMITLNAMTKSNNWKMFICKSHIVWKLLKISHLNFSILALSEAIFVWSRCLTSSFMFFQKPKLTFIRHFFLNFCPLKMLKWDIFYDFQTPWECDESYLSCWSIYSRDEITNCLAEMMNPRYRFEELTRAERVACIKGLRVTIEDRRGELLMKEIERRISEQSSNAEYEA